MQKLGQHFLKNAAVLEGIVSAIAPAEGGRVIEVGPGHGELTMPLMRAAKGNGGEVICIEKDRALAEELRTLGVNVVEGDALALLPGIVARSGAEAKDYKIVGNIPYYITGKLLRTMSELDEKPTRAVLLVQEEVAERMCAAPPHMNRLAASVQFWAAPHIALRVPRRDFSPPPDVDSAVIVLDAVSGAAGRRAPSPVDAMLYYRAVRAVFAQPRKTLLNNLAAIDNANGGVDAAQKERSKRDIAAILKNIGVDPASRPQDLDVTTLIAIAKAPLWG